MVLPRPKRRAIAAVYAFAREVDDVADGELPLDEKRARLEALRARSTTPPGDDATARRARRRARALRDSRRDALSALVDGGLQDTRADALRRPSTTLRGYCEKVAGAVGVACVAVYGSDDVERARDARRRAAADQHHARRARGLGARPRLPAAGRARRATASPRPTSPRASDARVAGADGVPGRARARAPRRGAGAARLARPAQRALRRRRSPGLYRATLDRIETNGFDVFGGPPRLSAPAKLAVVGARAAAMKAVVVGGGLAGLAAALDLVDAGADVTRARGAADARRRRADAAGARGRPGAAAGQRPAHRARLLHRVPALPRPDRRERLGPAQAARAAGASRRTGRGRTIRPARSRCSATGICRCATAFGSRRRARAGCAARRRATTRPSARCCAGSARPTPRSTASGTSSSGRR